MTEKELWNEYCEKCSLDNNIPYEAWCFGDGPDKLADLVYTGKKTATSSLLALYELSPYEKIPQVGDISVILDGSENAVCIIRNTKVYTVKFHDISDEFAYKEGEGDLSLSYWQKVHNEFFKKEAAENGVIFNEDAEILCEELVVIYRH